MQVSQSVSQSASRPEVSQFMYLSILYYLFFFIYTFINHQMVLKCSTEQNVIISRQPTVIYCQNVRLLQWKDLQQYLKISRKYTVFQKNQAPKLWQ